MATKENAGITRWIRGLVTKEDPQFIHKLLGVLSLASFTWRLTRVGDDDMGFDSHPAWTIPTLLLHLALSASSFQFRIPPRRITTDGGRIWPEYRLHSLIFSARSMACIAVHWYEQHYYEVQLPTDYSKNLWIVLACMGAADLASYAVGPFHSNSVRALSAPALAKYFFSVMQFFATAAHLVDSGRRRRRIWTSGAIMVLTACTAALWRMGPWPRACRNKFVIWTVVYYGLDRVLRPILAQENENNTWSTQLQMSGLAFLELTVVIAHGIYKTTTTRSPSSSPGAKNV
eukprot:scaffold1551_cov166-Amphora_coffeaeformis.AAC.5